MHPWDACDQSGKMKWVQTDLKRNSDRWVARFKLPPTPRRTPQDYERLSLFGREANAWCLEQFGKPFSNHPSKYRWAMDGWNAHFRYEADAFAFKMRWC